MDRRKLCQPKAPWAQILQPRVAQSCLSTTWVLKAQIPGQQGDVWWWAEDYWEALEVRDMGTGCQHDNLGWPMMTHLVAQSSGKADWKQPTITRASISLHTHTQCCRHRHARRQKLFWHLIWCNPTHPTVSTSSVWVKHISDTPIHIP